MHTSSPTGKYAEKMWTLTGFCNFTKIVTNSYVIWACLVILSSTGFVVDEQEFDQGKYNEFKVEIPGSYEECFYIFVPETATFYTNIEVLRGQDQKVDFTIRMENMDVVHSETYIQESTYTTTEAKQGTYSVCIDNIYSRFGSKLVYIYMTAFEPAKFEAYIQEMETLESLASNATTYLNGVQDSVMTMLMHQARRRFHMVHDMYLARGNNYYVFAWSLFQCVVIIICSFVQVYMVRRLFRTSNVTPTTAKPRA